MSLTTEQKTNNVGFPKAGEIIEITGAHDLEASDRAILNLLYQHAHDSGRLLELGAEWEVPMGALKPSAQHKGNERVRDSLDRLMRIVVKIPTPDAKTGEPRILLSTIFDFFNISADESAPGATVRYGLKKLVQPILARSNRWGRIKAEIVCAMTSKYAIALYELVQLRSGMDRCVEQFTPERFRELMGVPPGKLGRGADFERYCIQPALLEVNGLSDLRVQVELRRAHATGPIKSVELAWWQKEGEDYRKTLAERHRAKAGRMARLRGTVETIPDLLD